MTKILVNDSVTLYCLDCSSRMVTLVVFKSKVLVILHTVTTIIVILRQISVLECHHFSKSEEISHSVFWLFMNGAFVLLANSNNVFTCLASYYYLS